MIQAGQAGGERTENVGIGAAEADRFQELFKVYRPVAFERRRFHQGTITDAHSVDDDEVCFRLSVGRNRAQIVFLDNAHAAPFHLFEQVRAAHIAQEHHDFERADIGAGRNHIDRDGDARVVTVAKRFDDRFRLFAYLFPNILLRLAAVVLFHHPARAFAAGAVGDFLAELVAFAELFAEDLHNIIGVGVVFGEDQGFGNMGAVRKNLGEELVAEGADHRADLVGNHHIAVQLAAAIGKLLVEQFGTAGAGEAVALFDVKPGIHFGAGPGNLRADIVDVVIDIDAVLNGFGVAVIHHHVAVEKADGLFGGRGGKTDQESIKVFEHLPPKVVNRAVAFVGNDEVKSLNADGRVVPDRIGEFGEIVPGLGGLLFLLLFQVLADEHGIKTLDGRDADFRYRVNFVAGEKLGVIQFGELAAVIGGDKLLKLVEGLHSQRTAIHQEENAARAGKFDEPVDEIAGSKGLAAAGRHLDQRARAAVGKRAFQVENRSLLRGPQIAVIQRRKDA